MIAQSIKYYITHTKFAWKLRSLVFHIASRTLYEKGE